jgi:hypothetical protein
MRIGSQEHKELFCRTFLDAHRSYEPKTLPWPDLSEVHLERIKAIPFWRTALGVEQNAGRMVGGFAQTIRDPLVREAVELQAYEESRHARLLSTFIERYGIDVEPPSMPEKKPTKSNFTVFGYEECLDSYFGFGIFGIARRYAYMPDEMLELFEPILLEEAQHIVFFVNWVAYTRAQEGVEALGVGLSAYGYLRAIGRLIATATGAAAEGTGFLAPGAGSVGAPKMTAREFLESCDNENRKYMSVFDPRLVQPRVLPALGAIALRLLPGAGVAANAAVTR